ncbi:MAG: UvrD-helicase domain-containing protein [Phycisphaerales bacterium]|nr:UvrD-helicase domain-containing protein [Phycisphaerales bacterium]
MVHEPDLLDQLTESQQQAVLHEVGPLLVLAGPGSGKTTVVTRRIARLMQGGVAPWSILALTFTNKAAGEMRERVRILVEGCDTRGLTVSTFHAFAARQLRMQIALEDLPTSPSSMPQIRSQRRNRQSLMQVWNLPIGRHRRSSVRSVAPSSLCCLQKMLNRKRQISMRNPCRRFIALINAFLIALKQLTSMIYFACSL